MPEQHRPSDPASRPDSTPRRKALYRPAEWALLRTPLLPVEFNRTLTELMAADDDTFDCNLRTQIANPVIRTALTVGSPTVTDAVDRGERIDADSRLARTLHHYLVRMCSRPTPYGLFAGVALVTSGSHTDLAIAPGRPATRTRPDMKWLEGLRAELEADPEIRRSLSYVTNPELIARGGRLLTPKADTADIPVADRTIVSVRATRIVRVAVDAARTPISHAELVEKLRAESAAPTGKVETLIEQLWSQQILLTDLRPTLTNIDPGEHLLEKLAQIPAAVDAHALLGHLRDAMIRWDATPLASADADYRQLIGTAERPDRDWSGEPPQVDMALPLSGRHINIRIARDAARAAELLLRLTPEHRRVSGFADYLGRFERRYPPGRRVRLADLLDPEIGLGSPYTDETPPPAPHEPARDAVLLEIAGRALRNGSTVIELDEPMLQKLSTPLVATDAPPSLDVSVQIAASSAADLDAGNYHVLVGPNTGAQSAGRVLGRFADLLGPATTTALEEINARESEAIPGVVFAELVYLPTTARSANVAIRKHTRDHEIVVGATPGVRPAKTIPVDELYVESTGKRLRLRWSARNVEIVVTAGHMLNPQLGPDLCRFLAELPHAGRTPLMPFDWGAAASLPALPRLQVGRIIVCPARYRPTELIRAANHTELLLDFAESVGAWRRRWQAPRYVYVGFHDNRLLVDLDSTFHLNGLRLELRRLQGGHEPVVEEALQQPDQVWLPGPGGHYVNELVIPLFRTSIDPAQTAASPLHPATNTLRLPGSDWLYVKVYCHPSSEDEVLIEAGTTFCRVMTSTGFMDGWFFIRYSDPEPHLRLRFHGDPSVLTQQLTPQLFRWVADLVDRGLCRHFTIDTYDREIERYGGLEGITLAENIFAADSAAVIDILKMRQAGDLDIEPTVLAAFTSHDLLTALGCSPIDQLSWCRQFAPRSSPGRPESRRQISQLRGMIAAELPGRDKAAAALSAILLRRHYRISDTVDKLDQIADSVDGGKEALLRSYVHMHCNRIGTPAGPREQDVLSTLEKALRGLAIAPIEHPRGDRVTKR